jgi:aerobic-type carbon monoxide dehydrogenase small subunit (CoxS/CutS family)
VSEIVRVEVNGRSYERLVEPRTLLSDFLRHDLGLHGTHVGCEHGVCGACTIQLDGAPVRSCLLFAVQADGAKITTIEGIAPPGELGPLQQAFTEAHALQCGFCTPGIIVMLDAYLREHPQPAEDQVRAELAGHLCRCTGYQPMLAAVRAVTGEDSRPRG